jgi:CheY-like chemotaxis protein
MNQTKRRKPIQVLMIDDDVAFTASFKNLARRFQVLITEKHNLKDGLDELLKNNRYQAVILDGKAPLSPDQPKGTEAENFVHEAIFRLRELELQHERPIPFCVLTAWQVQLEPALRNRARTFDKKKVVMEEVLLEEMFDYLRDEIEELEETKIKQRYPDIFEFAEKYLDEEDNGLLLNILSSKLIPRREVMLERLAFIRRLEESVLNVFCKYYLNEDPLLYGLDGQSRTKDLINLIKVKKLAPLHVSFFTYVIYTTQSLAVQHKAPESSEFYNYPITPYTVHTFINALLDIIVWVKDSIENGFREGGTTDWQV